MTTRWKNCLVVLCLLAVSAAGWVFVVLPYCCEWLPKYRNPINRILYYWDTKGQFLRCNNTLRQIDGAKDTYALDHAGTTNGAVLAWPDIMAYLKDMDGEGLQCPSGGEYIIEPLGTDPTCSIHGDSLTFKMGEKPYPTRRRPAQQPTRPLP